MHPPEIKGELTACPAARLIVTNLAGGVISVSIVQIGSSRSKDQQLPAGYPCVDVGGQGRRRRFHVSLVGARIIAGPDAGAGE